MCKQDIGASACEADAFAESTAAMEGLAATYDLLARVYREEADEALVEMLRGVRFPAHTGNENIDRGHWGISSYLSRVGESAVDDLAVDYSRTFIGGGIDSYSAAYPYESVHTGRRRLLMQGARDDVLAFFRAQGLDRSGSLKASEDHIAYELEFLGVLCDRAGRALAAQNLETADELLHVQRDFLEKHQLNWVGAFAKQVRHFSKTEFYRAVSYLTVGTLEEHAALLGEMLGDSLCAE